jgi:hypothetical protein
LGLTPSEWARWTLKQFSIAYEGWKEINVQGPWERARSIAFHTVLPHDSKGKLKRWSDVYPLEFDKDKKVKPKSKAIMREMNEEEKALYKQMLPNG